MELRVIARGALAGLIAGVLGFVFSKIFAEPIIQQAIDYEGGRGEALNALRTAAGQMPESEGPEIFSRTIQSGIGIATGIIGLAVAFGLLVAVAFLLLQGRVRLTPKALAWSVTGFGFATIFLLPFVKYPANPPAIGHDFTIAARTQLYLTMVVASTVLLALTIFAATRLSRRWGTQTAVIASALGFLVVFSVLLAALPSLGHLQENLDVAGQLGFAKAATETPQPIVNTFSQTLTVDGHSYAPGQIVYPGFDADLLWKFRWYSLLNQTLVWLVIAAVFGTLMQRLLRPSRAVGNSAPETVRV